MESDILKDIAERKAEYKPNHDLDELVNRLRSMLEPLQKKQNKEFSKPRYPILLVTGAPRSGTTLLSQILASSSNFCYPTNFLSRFAYAPMIGAMIQQMLFDPRYRFRNELQDLQHAVSFSSDLGKTDNALDINEFYHFWRRFFPNQESEYLNKDQLDKVKLKEFLQEIASIESVFEKPFLSKGKMFQQNIECFAKKVPRLIFLYIKRDPVYVMQSILLSRRKMYGRDDIWWAIKPREYTWLKDLDVYHQIAGQVLYSTLTVETALKSLPDNRKICINYEELCRDPRSVYEQLCEICLEHNYVLKDFLGPLKLKASNSVQINLKELSNLQSAYENLITSSEALNARAIKKQI